MEKRERLYEGRTRDLFETDDPDLLILSYKDDTEKSGSGTEAEDAPKGKDQNRMTNLIYKCLEQEGIPTHYVQEISDRETVVKNAKHIPIQMIVRNLAAGSFSERLGVEEGFDLICPTIEFRYKEAALGNPMINQYDAIAMGLISKEKMERMVSLAFKTNEVVTTYFGNQSIQLVECKMEFGDYQGQIILTSDFSVETCRLWDMDTFQEIELLTL